MRLVRKTVRNTISSSPALIDSRSDSLNGAKRHLPFSSAALFENLMWAVALDTSLLS